MIQHVLFGVASLNRPPPASPSVSLIRLFYCSVHEKYCSLTFENLNRRVGQVARSTAIRVIRLHTHMHDKSLLNHAKPGGQSFGEWHHVGVSNDKFPAVDRQMEILQRRY